MLEEKNKKNVLLVVLVILVLAVFIFYYFVYKNKALAPHQNIDSATMVQKIGTLDTLNAKPSPITKTEKAVIVKEIISTEVSTPTLSKEEKKNVLNILNN